MWPVWKYHHLNATFTYLYRLIVVDIKNLNNYVHIFKTGHLVGSPFMVTQDPILETQLWSTAVKAWTLWLSDCVLKTPERKQLF